MTHSRLFLAIPLPLAISEYLSELIAVFKGHKGISVTATDNLHITVHFYGNIADKEIGQLITSIAEDLHDFPPFELRMDKLTLYRPNHARMIWTTFQHSSQFALLAGRFQQLAATGQQPGDTREQKPHITCARVRCTGKITIPLPAIEQQVIPVDRIELWKSSPAERGVQYTSIATFPLTSN